MKKLLAFLMALASGGASAADQPSKPTMMDPRDILMSIPTISDDLAALEVMTGEPVAGAIVFHEDEWSQIEFFPKSRLADVKRVLTEYKPFELASRRGSGWARVYVREIERTPVVEGPDAVKRLETILGVKAGPAAILTSGGVVAGRVKNGFTLSLGSDACLYGYVDAGGIPVLAALIARDGDGAKLREAFGRLNASEGLVLVDWIAQRVLVAAGTDGTNETWSP